MVITVDVLDVEERGGCEDLSNFDNCQIIMAKGLGLTGSGNLQNGIADGVLPVSRDENTLKAVREGTNHKPATGCLAPKAHRCMRATEAILSGRN